MRRIEDETRVAEQGTQCRQERVDIGLFDSQLPADPEQAGAIDVGTIIDNEDCVYRAEKVFPSREEAESTVAAVRERAAAAAPASEPPQVDYTIVAAGDPVKLDLSIAFSCQAEKIIFELSLRNLL